jgi:hypothetical protein
MKVCFTIAGQTQQWTIDAFSVLWNPDGRYFLIKLHDEKEDDAARILLPVDKVKEVHAIEDWSRGKC